MVLAAVAADVANGADIRATTADAKRKLVQAGFASVDYVEVRDAATLKAVDRYEDKPLRVLAAVRLGKTRLIDNASAG